MEYEARYEEGKGEDAHNNYASSPHTGPDESQVFICLFIYSKSMRLLTNVVHTFLLYVV